MKNLIYILILSFLSIGAASQDFVDGDDILQCGSAAAIDDLGVNGEFTVAFWTWVDDIGEGSAIPDPHGQFFFDKRAGDDGGNGWFIRCGEENAGNAQIQMKLQAITSGSNWQVRTGKDFLTYGKWEWIMYVVDHAPTTTKNIDIYNDCVEEDSYVEETYGDNLEADAAGNLWLGSNGSTSNRGLNGKMAYIHIYDRKLSTDECKELKNRPFTIKNGLKFARPMWNDTGPDLSDNGHSVCTATAATVDWSDGPPIQLTGGGS